LESRRLQISDAISVGIFTVRDKTLGRISVGSGYRLLQWWSRRCSSCSSAKHLS